MSTDKLSSHYTSAEAYTDLDGQSRQFTFIDHDKKSKISALKQTEEEIQEIKNSLNNYRSDLVKRILEIPASLCPYEFVDFTIRGEAMDKIEWNKKMLEDEGFPLNNLRFLCTIVENKFGV
jgi:hypothetical protein